jgi:hypothetical protein
LFQANRALSLVSRTLIRFDPTRKTANTAVRKSDMARGVSSPIAAR